MAAETDCKPEEMQGAAQGLTRREALLQLLRVGGAAAGATGAAVWLSKHSFRPRPEQAEQARRDHASAMKSDDNCLSCHQGVTHARQDKPASYDFP